MGWGAKKGVADARGSQQIWICSWLEDIDGVRETSKGSCSSLAEEMPLHRLTLSPSTCLLKDINNGQPKPELHSGSQMAKATKLNTHRGLATNWLWVLYPTDLLAKWVLPAVLADAS